MKFTEENLNNFNKIILSYLKENENPDVPVVKYRKATDLAGELSLKIPKETQNESIVFETIKMYLEYSQRTSHPQFNNQLYAGINPPSVLGEFVTALTNTSMATYEIAPVATLMERELVKKMNSLAGFKGTEGIMCTGGSNANMLAIHCARYKNDNQVYSHGNSKKYAIFVSEQAHYSFEKAVILMGLGMNSLKLVKTDDNGKIIPSELDKLIKESIEKGEEPLLIASTAGTTVMGAFDPIDEINQVAKKFKLWHHVDGAWGGSALLSSKTKSLMQGIENCDSLTWDAHKLMGTGIITSFFLTQHKNILKEANSTGGGSKYIFHEYENRDYDTGPSSLQCGRKVDIIKAMA
jgi:glutamate/tyrosine decarboxylase-like PLP-dependent enzyme